MQNILCGGRDLIVGPEQIGAGGDDVFGRDFFDDGFVSIIVVGNRGAAFGPSSFTMSVRI